MSFETNAPRLSGPPTFGSDCVELVSSWFMKTVVPLRLLYAPSPSGIPIIWYRFDLWLVSGTWSPTESNAFVS